MQALTTGQLILEPLLAAHADEMFPLLREPELYDYLDYGPPPSADHLRQVYSSLEGRRSPDGSQRWLNWAIRTQDNGLVGYVQATVTNSGSAWIAYVLGRGSWGNGYATEATRCMMDHLADACGVRRFLATVERSNERSIAVLRRLGLREAGAEESSRHDLSPSERLYICQTSADVP
jgi:[ribosomal protein S5]-alanine N-acetyltransferase